MDSHTGSPNVKDLAKDSSKQPLPKALEGRKIYPFCWREVQYEMNLKGSDYSGIQVWNFGEIRLISKVLRLGPKSGNVLDGKVVAREEQTTINRPFCIPDMTPGVLVDEQGDWIDFGGIQVKFSNETEVDSTGLKLSTIDADGHVLKTAQYLPNRSNDWSIEVREVDPETGGFRTYGCIFQDEAQESDGPFLVFGGGSKIVTKNTINEKERRAQGRVLQ